MKKFFSTCFMLICTCTALSLAACSDDNGDNDDSSVEGYWIEEDDRGIEIMKLSGREYVDHDIFFGDEYIDPYVDISSGTFVYNESACRLTINVTKSNEEELLGRQSFQVFFMGNAMTLIEDEDKGGERHPYTRISKQEYNDLLKQFQ